MDQKVIFKYRVSTLGELVESNSFITEKVSQYHRNFLNFPQTLRYLTPYEEEVSIKALKEGKTRLKEEDVDYSINILGYRETKPVQQMYNSAGVWGCSYTFGVGVPAESIYSNILEKKLNTPVYNFGIPGGGIQKITRSFLVNNNYFKFKTAFFVLPSMYRFEFLSFNNYDTADEIPSENVSSFDLIPNWMPKHNKVLTRKGKLFYEAHDEAFFLMEFNRNLELIRQNAEINGTKVYFTTWCGHAYSIFPKYGITELELVDFVENNENIIDGSIKDFARDGFHPGMRSHQATADVLHNLFNGVKPPRDTKANENLKLI